MAKKPFGSLQDKNMFSKPSFKTFLISIFVIAAFFRLPQLSVWPPSTPQVLHLRYITALASLLSIGFYMELVYHVTGNKNLTLWSGLVLTLMPWHIEQSRIFSSAMWGLTTCLGGLWLILIVRKKVVQWSIICITLIIFYFVYPEYWFFHQVVVWPGWHIFLLNLGKLISIEFLFYANDSFWWGGLRTLGGFTVGFLPFFLIGIFTVIVHFNKHIMKWLVIFFCLWVIAALNPHFPEGREFFMAAPFLALVTAVGFYKVFFIFKTRNKFIKMAVIGCFIFLIYDYLLFIHFYINHYVQRIHNEVVQQRPIF